MHTRYEERYWVISGSMTVWAGQDQVTMGPGDYHVVPTNVPHMVRFGPEGTRALVFSTPPGFAQLVARTGTPAHLATPETELDTDRFQSVSTELGDVVLGPRGPRRRNWPTARPPGPGGRASPSAPTGDGQEVSAQAEEGGFGFDQASFS